MSRIVYETFDDANRQYETWVWENGESVSLAGPGARYKWASADGARIVFESGAALVPEDTNSHSDVYISDADLEPPEVSIEGLTPYTTSTATLELDTADGDGVWFDCRLDNAAWKPCLSSSVIKDLQAGPHVIDVVGFDAAANKSATKSAAWTADTSRPTVTSPTVRAVAGSAISTGKATFRVGWSGSDSTSGIARYELAQSTDGGSWTNISTSLGKASSDRHLTPSHTYRFRVRAVDKAGNVGTWATGATFTLSSYSERSSRITYSGTWGTTSSTAYWGGGARYASTAGARAIFTFTGKSFAWVARKGPGRGKAEVFVNGTGVATVDLYASAYQNQRVVWSTSWSSATKRTITIRAVGTSGRPRIDVDGVITTK